MERESDIPNPFGISHKQALKTYPLTCPSYFISYGVVKSTLEKIKFKFQKLNLIPKEIIVKLLMFTMDQTISHTAPLLFIDTLLS